MTNFLKCHFAGNILWLSLLFCLASLVQGFAQENSGQHSKIQGICGPGF